MPRAVSDIAADFTKYVADTPISILRGMSRIDGALVVTKAGEIGGFGVMLRSPSVTEVLDPGARTTAARAASKFGLAIKVSEDGPITAFKNGEQIV